MAPAGTAALPAASRGLDVARRLATAAGPRPASATAWLAVAALVAVAVMAGVPAVHAQSEVVVSAELHASETLDVREVEQAGPPPTADLDDCGTAGQVQVLPELPGFRFVDEAGEAACAEARLAVQVPAGATSFHLTFAADRTIERAAAIEPLQSRQVQEVRVYDMEGAQVDATAYYDPTAGPTGATRPFDLLLRTPPGASRMVVAWYFWDDSAPSGLSSTPGFGTAFTSTVRAPRVEFPGLAITEAHVTERGNETYGDRVVHSREVALEVPSALLRAPSNRIQLTVLADNDLVAVILPDGRRVAAGNVTEVLAGGVRTLTLGPEHVTTSGPYVFRLESVESLPPPPPPAPPATVYGLVVLAMLLPAPAFAGATWSLDRFRRERVARQVGTFWRMLATLTFVFAGYVAALAAGASRRDAMATIPVGPTGLLIYVALGLVALLFSVHWTLSAVQRREARELRHADELERANVELARSNRDLEQFAYVASHDLQEPLRKVTGFTTLLQKRYEGQLDRKADDYIRSANDAARRARALIQDLLAYSRLGSGQTPRVDVDLGAVMEEVREELAQRIKQERATVAVAPLPTVKGSPALLRQLLLNLVHNALKYRHADRAPVIEVQARRAGQEWRVEVRDNGIGIDPQYREQVFQLFQRLYREDTPGTGLGLAICKRIAEFHGGRIGFESVPGRGSTFFFTLPMG